MIDLKNITFGYKKKYNLFDISCFDLAKTPSLIDFILGEDNDFFDVYCIQLHSQETLIENLIFIDGIKERNPSAIIIAGGAAAQ